VSGQPRERERAAVTENPTGEIPVFRSPAGVRRLDSTTLGGPEGSASLLEEHLRRLGQERGAHLCRTSPKVARRAGALAAPGALLAGIAITVFLVRAMPAVVIVTTEYEIAWLAAGVVALMVATAFAGYALARWRHSVSIPANGETRSKGVGLVLAVLAAGGVALAMAPWWFPSAKVLDVEPLALGQYLAQPGVVGGLVVSMPHHEPVAYVKTKQGLWVASTISPSVVGAVEQHIPRTATFTRGEVAREVGNGQQSALRTDVERLWLVVGAMAIFGVAIMVVQRRRWRSAPWPAPVADDTVQAIARVYAHRG
jgi:hypothetical protein